MEYSIEIIGPREKSILLILKKSQDIGMTITDIANKLTLRRDQIRIALAKLIGAEKISFKKAGMAKVYYLLGNMHRSELLSNVTK